MAKMNKQRAKRMEAVYAKLPELQCKGLCQESCGPIGMEWAEARRIEEKYGGIPSFDLDKSRCSALNDEGQCTIYDRRPLICRMYGMVKGRMQCPFGCEPERWLSDEESYRIMAELAEAVGGHDEFWTATPEQVEAVMKEAHEKALQEQIEQHAKFATVEKRKEALVELFVRRRNGGPDE